MKENSSSGFSHPETGTESAQILPEKASLPHAEEQGDFFLYGRELQPGMRLEQYEIIRVLGSGGFGITYLAQDLFLDRPVVIKESFPREFAYRDPLTGAVQANNEFDRENYTSALKSFLSEARTLATLDHPGIVKIQSIFEANGTAYFAMEYVEGQSLEFIVNKLHETGHLYTEDELKGLLIRLLDILSYLHSHDIYHRDIKPANIMLTEQGYPVLIDFGAARHILNLRTATILSSQGFTAPEQILGTQPVGPWSDLYSLGATFYSLLTGDIPERSEVRMINDSMAPLHRQARLQMLYTQPFLLTLEKALSPDISCRYESARQWLTDIYSLTKESSATQLPGPTESEVPAPHPKKNPILPYLISGVICTILTIVSTFFWIDYQKKSPMGTTLKEVGDVIREPVKDKEKSQDKLSEPAVGSMIIPELSDDSAAPGYSKETHFFSLTLNNSKLRHHGLSGPLPDEVRLSCIYLQLTPKLHQSHYTCLVIRDCDGRMVGKSVQAFTVFPFTGHVTVPFLFPDHPELRTDREYRFSFETPEGQETEVDLSCVGIPNEEHSADTPTGLLPRIRILMIPPPVNADGAETLPPDEECPSYQKDTLFFEQK